MQVKKTDSRTTFVRLVGCLCLVIQLVLFGIYAETLRKVSGPFIHLIAGIQDAILIKRKWLTVVIAVAARDYCCVSYGHAVNSMVPYICIAEIEFALFKKLPLKGVLLRLIHFGIANYSIHVLCARACVCVFVTRCFSRKFSQRIRNEN